MKWLRPKKLRRPARNPSPGGALVSNWATQIPSIKSRAMSVPCFDETAPLLRKERARAAAFSRFVATIPRGDCIDFQQLCRFPSTAPKEASGLNALPRSVHYWTDIARFSRFYPCTRRVPTTLSGYLENGNTLMASAHGFALGPFLFRADHLIFRGPRLWALFIKPFSAASWFAPDLALCGARLRLAKDLACDVGQATCWLHDGVLRRCAHMLHRLAP